MKLSTKARHAVTAMIDVALRHNRNTRHNSRLVTLAEISQNQGISLSYLEQLFARLRKCGLVTGVRGPGGGYRLARMPSEISVAQIILAIDDQPDQSDPLLSGAPLEKKYITHRLWEQLSERMYGFLNGITLDELADQAAMLNASDQAGDAHTEQDQMYSNRNAA